MCRKVRFEPSGSAPCRLSREVHGYEDRPSVVRFLRWDERQGATRGTSRQAEALAARRRDVDRAAKHELIDHPARRAEKTRAWWWSPTTPAWWPLNPQTSAARQRSGRICEGGQEQAGTARAQGYRRRQAVGSDEGPDRSWPIRRIRSLRRRLPSRMPRGTTSSSSSAARWARPSLMQKA